MPLTNRALAYIFRYAMPIVKDKYGNRCTVPFGSAHVSGIELRCVWKVEADSTYDIRHMEGSEPTVWRNEGLTGLFALRTLSGKGRITLYDGQFMDVRANSLVLCQWERVCRYHCTGSKWNFWFLEFLMDGPLHVPIHKPLRIPHGLHDEDHFQELLSDFESTRPIRRCMASSRVLLLLHEWSQRHVAESRDLNEERIERVICEVQASLNTAWTVTDMAKSAGMSVAWFRREFHRLTGSSPKQLFDRLRLARADELLRTTGLTIGEIAFRLNYSSPFHLSKAFKQHYGVPPSAVRA